MIYADIKQFLNRFVPENQNQKRALLAVLILGGGSTVVYKIYSSIESKNRKNWKQIGNNSNNQNNNNQNNNQMKKKRIAVDKVFFKRLFQIIRIIIPNLICKETIHIFILTSLLFARTILSIRVADIMGANARFLVERNFENVKWGIAKFFFLSVPASFVNSALKYETDMLSLRFRRRLTQHVHEEYLRGVNFYKASHLGGQNRIDNADQRVTDDIEKFASSISNLYANIFKPVLDVVLFTRKLTTVVGFRGPLMMYGYYIFSSILLRTIMPPFPKLVAKESELEGDFRTAHQRLITNAEEISFYDGSKREKEIINNAFTSIYKHSSHVNWLKMLIGVFDGMLVKYGASIVGYVVMCLPVFFYKVQRKNEDSSASGLTRDYVRNTQLLINLARAIGSLVLIYKRVTSLAGYTSRVAELLEMVRHLDKSGKTPFSIKQDDDAVSASSEAVSELKDESYVVSAEEIKAWLEDWRRRGEEIRQKKRNSRQKIRQDSSSQGNGGKFIEGDFIKFVDVSIVSPEGKLLVSNLNFEVKPEHHVMISGPNGSGKSSLFRILGELWPLHCGVVTKPDKEEIFYVPQKPYLVLGNLRDQIIYPHSEKDMRANGVTDEDLEHLMDLVDPSKTILKQWKWNEVKDWLNTFSGGQKQRVAMARLFYHRPRYAILDECTSAVSFEVEGKIYETCATLGITLFTVSHRPQLRRYHDFELRFDGEGGWQFSKIEV